MSTLCFGTFFTLLCGNKKDWDKKRKPEVSNRVLYFALLDIIGKNDNNPHHHAEKATTGEVSGYKNDIVSDAKNCRRDEHPIQRTWNVTRYIERFTQEHTVVLADFVEFITKYLDEQQRERLALSVIELIKNSGLNDNVAFHIGDNATAFFEKKKIKDEKRDYNLPSILAGVMYYIIKNDIPNGSAEAQGTIDDWKTTYTDAPYCPCGETLDEEYKINLICIVPEPLNEKEPARNEADNNTHKLPRDNMDSQTTPESNHGRNQSRAIPDTQTHLYEQQLGEEYYNLIVHWAYEPEDCWLNKDRVVMSRDRVIEGYVSDEIDGVPTVVEFGATCPGKSC